MFWCLKKVWFAPKLVPLDEAEAFSASSPNCCMVDWEGNGPPQWPCSQMDGR